MMLTPNEVFFSKELIYLLFIVLFLFLYYFVKSKILNRILKEFWNNKLFFLFSFSISLIAILLIFPFTHVTYYDETVYILLARNFVETGNCTICSTEENFICEEGLLPPHAIGIPMIYSLLYSHDYSTYFTKISIFNIFLHMCNSIVLFSVSQQIFKKKIISQMAAILVLFAPQNLIHSSTAMITTVANSFLLISLFAFITFLISYNMPAKDQGKFFGKEKINMAFFIVLSLILLTSVRLEYIVLLFGATIYFLILAIRYATRKGIRDFFGKLKSQKLNVAIAIFLVVILYLITIFFCWYLSGFFNYREKVEFFTMENIWHYTSNVSFIVLSIFFLIALISIVFLDVSKLLKHKSGKDILKLIVLICFFYLAFFCIKNTGKQYRYLMPLTSLYLLLASMGVVFLFSFIMKNKRVLKVCVWILLVFFCLNFSTNAKIEKEVMIQNRLCDIWLFEYALSQELKELTLGFESENSYYFCSTPFLFRINSITNYTSNFGVAQKYINRGYNVYYLKNYFQMEFDSNKNYNLDYFDSELPLCPNYGLALISSESRLP